MVEIIRKCENQTFPPFCVNFFKAHDIGTTYERWLYSCDKHGDFTALVVDGKHNLVCPECVKEAGIAEASAEILGAFEERLVKDSGIPADNAWATFEDFEIRDGEIFDGQDVGESDRAALHAVQALAKEITNPYMKDFLTVRNVTLCGSTGQGKSFLMSAASREFKLRGQSVLYIKDSALLDEVLATWKKGGPAQKELRQRFLSYDLLIVDDVDYERWRAAKNTFLADILIERYDAMKQTGIITNRPASDMKTCFGDAVGSRLRKGKIVTMIGEDRRKKQKMQEGA